MLLLPYTSLLPPLSLSVNLSIALFLTPGAKHSLFAVLLRLETPTANIYTMSWWNAGFSWPDVALQKGCIIAFDHPYNVASQRYLYLWSYGGAHQLHQKELEAFAWGNN